MLIVNIPSLVFLGGLCFLLLIFNDLIFDYLTFILNDEQLGELEMNYPNSKLCILEKQWGKFVPRFSKMSNYAGPTRPILARCDYLR